MKTHSLNPDHYENNPKTKQVYEEAERKHNLKKVGFREELNGFAKNNYNNYNNNNNKLK